MFDNRWDNWASDFAESFPASTFEVPTRSRVADILHHFGAAMRRLEPDFPDSASPTSLAAAFQQLGRLALPPAVRDDVPEVIARCFEFLQDGGRLGEGYAWAEEARRLVVGVSSPPKGDPARPKAAPIRNTPQTSVGRNDPCPCGSGKKYKKCCHQ